MSWWSLTLLALFVLGTALLYAALWRVDRERQRLREVRRAMEAHLSWMADCLSLKNAM